LPGALALASSILSPLITNAQTPDKKTAIGAYISTLNYRGNLGSDFFKLHTPVPVGVGAHITRYLSPSFDLSLQGNYQNYYRFVSDNAPRNSFTARTGTVDLGFKLKLNNGKILKEDAFIQPYLMGGGGLFFAKSYGNYASNAAGSSVAGTFSNNLNRFEVFGAAGLRFRLSPSLALDIQTSQHYPFTERVDNLGNTNDKLYDRFLVHSAGLTQSQRHGRRRCARPQG
jgi:OOP family OmpA-OmpF porin